MTKEKIDPELAIAEAAFAEMGEESYWEMLGAGPIPVTSPQRRRRSGTGYDDTSAELVGTGHASDPVPPVDAVIKPTD